MKKNKLFSVFALSSLLVSAPALSGQAFAATETIDSPTYTQVDAPYFDHNIVNEDRLLAALKQRGVITSSDSASDAQKKLKAYITQKSTPYTSTLQTTAANTTTPPAAQRDKHIKNLYKNYKEFHLKHNKETGKKSPANGNNSANKGLNGKSNVPKAKDKKYTGPVREDNVLVLLVEYSDFKHNNIDKQADYMYSDDFNKQHYEKMLFGDKQFTLYDGTKVDTFKQFYEEQSGGSYTVKGTVSDWLTVPGKAKDYGDDNPNGGHDNLAPLGPRDLVKDSLNAAVASGMDLSQFDKLDIYDLDGDGNTNEPDGLIDHLMIIHAGVGQEAGGGRLGDDAIWSHRWVVGNQPYAIANTTASVPYWGGKMAAFDYTIEPEDGAVGVFAHEFGHDLGLPDEYDTQYSGNGEPIASWSVMSGGSWNGRMAGTEPTSFSPQNKEFFQKTMGGNWANIVEVDASKLNSSGTFALIDQSVTKSANPGMVKVNLPDKEIQGIQPIQGKNYYYSTKGDNLHSKMTTPLLDLTNATTASLNFESFYEIETDYDYLTVSVVDESGQSTVIDTIGDSKTDIAKKRTLSGGFTTTKEQWLDVSYDLSAFAGKKVKVQFSYDTDGGLVGRGFTMDSVNLTVNGATTYTDDAEGTPTFTLDKAMVSNGIEYANHYYYLEWRNYAGSDNALKYSRGVVYNTGLLTWYADDSYSDNWTGIHPGRGFLGVVDSHPKAIVGTLNGKQSVAQSTRYQVADAAFSQDKTPAWTFNSPSRGLFEYTSQKGVTTFNDSNNYFDETKYSGVSILDAGRYVPNYGIKVQVLGEAKDNSAGLVWIRK
ncbi:MAG: immune inhibitor A domain-containing protein [Bacillaceae bacterium]